MTHLESLLEEIGRKSGDYAIAADLKNRIAMRTSSAAGQALVEEFALDGFRDGYFRALCDCGQAFAPATEGGKVRDAKAKMKWRDMSYAQQAAMRCNEVDFWRFLDAADSKAAADVVRSRCGVTSRAAIVRETEPGRRWERLEGDYFAWQRGRL